MNHEPIIYIVDDDQAIAESLAWMIESVGFKTKTFFSAKKFLATYHPEQSGCLILDVRMPEMSGPELQDELNKNNRDIPIIFISGYGDIALAVRVMKAGAIDFLTKPFNDQVLLESINKAIRIDRIKRKKNIQNKEMTERVATLSAREYEIMGKIVSGKLNKVIAADLNISLKTVEAHRASIMKKMQIKSLPELITVAINHRLCENLLEYADE